MKNYVHGFFYNTLSESVAKYGPDEGASIAAWQKAKFVMFDPKLPPKAIEEDLDDERVPALPFREMYLEGIDDDLLALKLPDGSNYILLISLLLEERSPGVIGAAALFKHAVSLRPLMLRFNMPIVGSAQHMASVCVKNLSAGKDAAETILALGMAARRVILALCEALEMRTVLPERKTALLRLPSAAGPKSKRVDSVIVMRPATEGSGGEAMSEGTKWSVRTWTRGHWRKVSGVGLDRDGKRCVNGFTWVNEHIRGPEWAPVKNGPRVVAPLAT